MPEEKKYSTETCHKKFAVELNNLVWGLLEKNERTNEENEKMIHAAHSSCYHWGVIGKPINLQRGEWLISHVYSILNRAEPALYHAIKCMQLTESQTLLDFDLAYSYEGVARAYACAGKKSVCEKYYKLAQEFGAKIKNEEDKKIFLSDFAAEPWYRMN